MMRIFSILGLMLLAGNLCAQELTLSPYSRYGIGDIFSSTTTRNASMGGAGIATDNPFSINRLNPATYADLVLTTMDVSAFGQVSLMRTSSARAYPIAAGIYDAAFAFPAIKGPAFVFGFAPYSAVGYRIRTQQTVYLDGDTLLERVAYRGQGGLNQAYIGVAGKMLNNRLRLGGNVRFLFGETEYSWLNTIYTNDTLRATQYQPITVAENVFISGWNFQGGFIYQDTLSKKKNALFRIGATAEYSAALNADRVTLFTNNLVQDTLKAFEEGTVNIPAKFGAGISFYRPGFWSVSADITYRNWAGFTYFSDDVSLGKEIRISAGAEITPNPDADNYGKRINYRFGGYLKQGYITYGDQLVNDYGVTLGVGFPGARKGTNRFSFYRLYSRLNLAAEVGRRGSLNAGQPLEEYYASLRLGFSINDRWFVKRVVD
ncbi:MAG: hypothetical protein EAZ89_05275 [Bacteroidetes bacterium]|nr:MAG: hypothetical protein EAZ89_05275 [Bacteroidota bacterium]